MVALLLFPAVTFAQLDGRKAGIYAIVGGESVSIPFQYGSSSVSGSNGLGVELTETVFRYKGEASGIAADSTFVLVLNPEQKEVIKKMKEYGPFLRNMRPTRVKVIPLEVNVEEHCREFRLGSKLEAIRLEEHPGLEFDWEKISDNSFDITVHGLVPGEYCFVICPQPVQGFNFSAIFGFTVK